MLDEVPTYVGESIKILHGLGDRFQKVNLPSSIFGALLMETSALATAKQNYDDKTGTADGANRGRKGDIRDQTKAGVALQELGGRNEPAQMRSARTRSRPWKTTWATPRRPPTFLWVFKRCRRSSMKRWPTVASSIATRSPYGASLRRP